MTRGHACLWVDPNRRAEVIILDRYEGAASVRTTFDQWIDYMHIVKVGDDWKIINVLWELTPETWASRTDKARSSEPSWPRGHSQTADSRSTKADPSAGCPYRTTAIGRAKHGVVSRCHGSCLRNQPGKWSVASFTPASNDGGHHLQPIRA